MRVAPPALLLRVGRTVLVLLCFLTPVTAFTAPGATPPPEKASPEELSAARRFNGEFAIDLYRQLAAEKFGGNIFLSPFSISTALIIAAEGAVDETAREMDAVLHLTPRTPRKDGFPALVAVHRAQAGLAAAAAPPEVPGETRATVANLRARLKAANRSASELQAAGKYTEAARSNATAYRLADELNRLLGSVDLYELRIANALWVEKTFPLRQSYHKALESIYGAVLHPVDFRRNYEPARLEINQWVAERTRDRIQNLIPQGYLDEFTRLVITNAVYFKGEWAEPFQESSTSDAPFRTADAGSRSLRLMHQLNRSTASYGACNADGSPFSTPWEIPVEMQPTDPSLYPDARGFTLLALPYKGRNLSMVWLLPRSASGIPALERLLTDEQLQSWIDRLVARAVDLFVPRFKLETNYSLVRPLQALGMVRAFKVPGRHPQGAEFDAMTESRNPEHKLFISEVLHKSFVEVNEKGTEAAAATAVIMAGATAAMRQEPKTKPFIPIFKANQPFLFLIRDNATGNILFLGRFVEPG